MDESIYTIAALWYRKDDDLQNYMEYGAAVGPLREKADPEMNANSTGK